MREPDSDVEGELEVVPLRRTISLPWLVLYGLGTTVGAGIYALTGVVAGRAGMLMPAAFVLAALLAVFTAFSFAELSSRFPRAGGEAVYVREGFGGRWLFVTVGLLAALSGVVSAATVTVGLVGYMREFTALPGAVIILCSILALGSLAAWGVRESVVVAGTITILEVGGLLLIAAFGASSLSTLPDRIVEFVPSDLQSLHTVAAAAVICFYAFLGFEDMVNVAEEVKSVRRTLPLGILVTVTVTALIYGAVTTVAVLVVPPEDLAASDAPLALVFERSGGSSRLIGGIAVLALVNGALIQIVKASRILYGLAREGALPARLGRVHERRRTPMLATALVVAVIAFFALAFPIAALAEFTATITLVTFTLANLALMRVKARGPAPANAFVVPAWIPVAGAFVSALFLCLEFGTRLP